MRPTCLILHLTNKAFRYENLLRQTWSKQFLDVSVLEIIKLDNSKQFQFFKREIATLHYMNPFTEIYTKKTFTSKTKLFPTKLRNLNQHQLKMGVYNNPPYLRVERNLTGHPLKITGPGSQLSIELSKVMNFKMISEPTHNEFVGNFDYNREKATGLFHLLTHNQIQFIANQMLVAGPRELNILERSTYTGEIEVIAVVPILPANSSSTIVTKNFIIAGFFIILIFIVTWVVSRSLKFNSRYWRWMYLVQLTLGSSVPEEPQKVQERIVFTFMFFACMLYSSWIYLEMTQIILTTQQEVEFSRLEDLVHSNLIPVCPSEAACSLLKNMGDESTLKVVEKSFIASTKDCVKMLMKHKNISCVMTSDLAELKIQEYKDKYNQPTMKMVGEKLVKSLRVLKLEPGSPFIERFNDLIMKLHDAGLNSKWYDFVDHQQSPRKGLLPKQLAGAVEARWQLFSVLLIGFTASLIVFVGEVIVGKVKKK